jgi:hypothetical protein
MAGVIVAIIAVMTYIETTDPHGKHIAEKVTLGEAPSDSPQQQRLPGNERWMVVTNGNTAEYIHNAWVEGSRRNAPRTRYIVRIWDIAPCDRYAVPLDFAPTVVHFTVSGNHRWRRTVDGDLADDSGSAAPEKPEDVKGATPLGSPPGWPEHIPNC